MRALNILVEGDTEEAFVKNLIMPYFLEKGISNIRPITIETSKGFKGGDISYSRFERNIRQILYGKEDLLVTSLIDFYRLSNDFPGFHESLEIEDRSKRVDFLEAAAAQDIKDDRFVPYIQLHEFEGLLFSDTRGFEVLFQHLPNADRKELHDTVIKNINPELINDNPNTSPSNRLKRLIPDYDKPFHGNMIAMENGFEKILEKCPRFNSWVEHLLTRMKA